MHKIINEQPTYTFTQESHPILAPSKIHTICQEVLTVIAHVLPSFIRWNYRQYVQKSIHRFSLKLSIDKIRVQANLFFHLNSNTAIQNIFKSPDKNQKYKMPALLFLHGDHSRPYTLLPLIDTAQHTYEGLIFSLYMPYDSSISEKSSLLLKKSIDKIQEIIKTNGLNFPKIITIGHSKGAIQAAHCAFVEKNPAIHTVVSIAGRLRVVPSQNKDCHPSLKPILTAIEAGLKENPSLPLYQIVPDNDWNAPYEAMTPRNDSRYCHLIPNSSHLSVLFNPQTALTLSNILKNCCTVP